MISRKKRKPINKYSIKKIAELNAEAPIRLSLIARCHGIPEEHSEIVYYNGKRYTIRRVSCIGGYCECNRPECGGRWATGYNKLHPHEYPSRAQGGKVSMSSKMVLNECHAILQGNDVRLKWLK